MVGGSRTIGDADLLLRELDSPSFNPRAEVLLSESPSSRISTPGETGQATFLRDDPECVEIRVNSERPGFLVLSDSYYPGWQATIAGERRTIYRANYMFRAVRIDAGESVVTFSYKPSSFRWGMVVSLLCLGFTAIAGVFPAATSPFGRASEARTKSPASLGPSTRCVIICEPN